MYDAPLYKPIEPTLFETQGHVKWSNLSSMWNFQLLD